MTGKISRSEYRFVFLMAIAMLVVTSIPYVYGYASTPQGKTFMGLMQNVSDHGQYLSWWRSFQSNLLINNKLTPEPNQPLFFNLLWWLLAQFSRLTGTGYPLAYQILRVAAGFSLFWAVYRFIALFFADVARRRAAFLMVALTSGFGWLLIVAKYTIAGGETPFPLLIFTAEPNYFLCLLGFPHFALAAAFICLVLEFIFRGWKENSLKHMTMAGAIGFVMGWMHAYDLLIIYGVTGVFFLAQWARGRKFPTRFFWGATIMAVLSVAPAVYSFLLTSLDPLWEEVLAQFANAGVYTPMPPLLFFLFGVPLFLAVWALVRWVREKRWTDERVFVVTWFVVGFFLLYIPTDFQIHMLNSWQIPTAILASAVLYDRAIPALARRLPAWSAARAERLALALLVAVLIPTNLYLFAWRFIELRRATYPYYVETGYIEAMNWLRAHTQPEDVVLSSLEVGQYVPAFSGNQVFLGHWANTIRFFDKTQRVKDFFNAGAPESQRAETVQLFGVDYVLYGPAESALGSYPLARSPWLKPVFEAPQVTLYQVQAEKLLSTTPAP